jgi:hypothetical protein
LPRAILHCISLYLPVLLISIKIYFNEKLCKINDSIELDEVISSYGNRLNGSGEFLGQLNNLATAIRQTDLHNAPYNIPYISVFTIGLFANVEAFRGKITL